MNIRVGRIWDLLWNDEGSKAVQYLYWIRSFINFKRFNQRSRNNVKYLLKILRDVLKYVAFPDFTVSRTIHFNFQADGTGE